MLEKINKFKLPNGQKDDAVKDFFWLKKKDLSVDKKALSMTNKY